MEERCLFGISLTEGEPTDPSVEEGLKASDELKAALVLPGILRVVVMV